MLVVQGATYDEVYYSNFDVYQEVPYNPEDNLSLDHMKALWEEAGTVLQHCSIAWTGENGIVSFKMRG